MSTTMEDAIRRGFGSGVDRIGAERPNAIESSTLRQRSRRVAAAPADLTQARRFHSANVDVRERAAFEQLSKKLFGSQDGPDQEMRKKREK